MTFKVQHLSGISLRGTGAYFPARTVTNAEILDLMIEHHFCQNDRHGAINQLRHVLARGAGRVLKGRLRRRFPQDADLIKHFGFPPSIVEKMGIDRRQWAHRIGDRLESDGEHCLDMAMHAAKDALEDARLTPGEIDALVVTTTTPPRINSSSALWMADRLGIAAPAYDLRAGCSGGLYGLLNASLYLQHGAQNVLVVGAEAYSRYLPPTNRDAIFLAGDGAGAAVLSRSAGPEGVIAGLIGADGQYDRRFFTRGGMPPTPEAAARGHYYVEGEPRDMVEASFKRYLTIIPEVLEAAGLGIEAIDYHVPHQTSLSVIKSVAARIGHPLDRTFVNIHEHGNIGSACLLAGLHEARAQGELKPGSKLLTSVVGGTMTWGAMVWQL
ncbi:MAG: 3-oxoacyl-ACP synthase III family protein [Candidatus Sericytochromatia bacterium]